MVEPNSKFSSVGADLSLIFAAALWGTTFTLVKTVVHEVPAILTVGYRFSLAALVLGVLLILRKKQLFAHLYKGVILGAILWMLYFTQTLGLQFTSAANSGFITGLFIVLVPIFSFLFFREMPSKQKLVALLFSTMGLWFLAGGISGLNKGDILTLFAAAGNALYILAAHRFVHQANDPVVLSFQQFAAVGLFSLVVAPFFGVPFAAPSLSISLGILFLALFPTLIAFTIQLVAQRYTTPIKVALIFALEPVFAAAFAWTFGGEQITLASATGGFMMVLGMLISEIPMTLLGVKHDKNA